MATRTFQDAFAGYVRWLGQQQVYQVEQMTEPHGEAIRVTHQTSNVVVHFYKNGTVTITGADGELKTTMENLRAALEVSHARLVQLLGPDLIDFMEENDVYSALNSLLLLEKQPRLLEYTPLAGPFAKAFEGYCQKLLVALGIANKRDVEKSEWNFNHAWTSAKLEKLGKKKNGKEHKRMLSRLKEELPYSRHRVLHGGFGPRLDLPTIDSAERKLDAIATLMRETFAHFRTDNLI